jgi:hypothetical protein
MPEEPRPAGSDPPGGGSGSAAPTGTRDPSVAAGKRHPSADPGPGRRLTDEERVERAFFRGDRLVSIPARVGKRAILLPIIRDRCFPEDRDYEEKEVNMRLALLHPDVAALRRYLVDEGLMTRGGGIYRRAPDRDRPAEP